MNLFKLSFGYLRARALNTVLNVLQKGYALNERVIRPALVIVSRVKA